MAWSCGRATAPPAGTVLVKDINPASASSNPANLTNVNGTLYFAANDGSSGIELWQSDGTAAGTVLVMDINPGSTGSNPANLTNSNGTLFFRADDGVHGPAPWVLPASSSSAASLAVSGFPTTTTAGVPGSFTVTAKNTDGTTATGYTGTVHFTSSDGQAVAAGQLHLHGGRRWGAYVQRHAEDGGHAVAHGQRYRDGQPHQQRDGHHRQPRGGQQAGSSAPRPAAPPAMPSASR